MENKCEEKETGSWTMNLNGLKMPRKVSVYLFI